jgi:hypothetical protein
MSWGTLLSTFKIVQPDSLKMSGAQTGPGCRRDGQAPERSPRDPVAAMSVDMPTTGYHASSSLRALLDELSPRLRAVVDTDVFASLTTDQQQMLHELAELTGAHIVAYDLRVQGSRLPLCDVVVQAYPADDLIAALRAAEATVPSWIALVAYARPARVRLPEDALVRAAELFEQEPGDRAGSHDGTGGIRWAQHNPPPER